MKNGKVEILFFSETSRDLLVRSEQLKSKVSFISIGMEQIWRKISLATSSMTQSHSKCVNLSFRSAAHKFLSRPAIFCYEFGLL